MIRSCFAGRSALLDAIRWQRHVSRPPHATGRTQAIGDFSRELSSVLYSEGSFHFFVKHFISTTQLTRIPLISALIPSR